MSALFVRTGDRIESRLTVDDKALLIQIPDLLATVDVGDPAHPVLNREAYRTDPTSEIEYRALIGAQLDRDRRSDLEAIGRLTASEGSITEEDARSVLRSVNAARLALAARSGVLDDPVGWESRISEDPSLAAVAWLGYVQDELLRVLRPE